MTVAAVTPIIGEFGYIVFDIQPRVRFWLRQQKADRKVVFASRQLAPLFEEATEIVEIPGELLPTAPATMRSIVYEHWREGDPERLKIERLVQWAQSTVAADSWLEIPYFQHQPWTAPATHVLLQTETEISPEPFIAIAARARQFDTWRNWPTKHWDELVGRIREEWKLQVRCVGKPPSTYFPEGAIPQDVDEQNRLDHSIAILNKAVCSISSNSGPTHLSLLAGCPTFAWGEPYLKHFMEQYTNPLRTPCCFYPCGWDPNVDLVWTALCRWREALQAQGVLHIEPRPRTRSSMCMIARDSSRTIRDALESIKPWVDEMVVVDTGSTDSTVQIAESCGARVHHAPWVDSFSAARNESLRFASGDWIFWMDSDDTVDEHNGRKIRALIETRHAPSTMAFVLQVQCPATASGAYASSTVVDHVKVFRRIPAIAFSGRIHEQVLPSIRLLGGVVEWTSIYVTHSGSDQTAEGRARKQNRDLRLLELELADDPDGTFTLFNLGMTYLDMSRPTDALNVLCRSLQVAEAGDSHLRKVYSLLVQAYTELGRAQTAMKTCIKGLLVCPGDPELLFRAGVLYQTLGDLESSERAFKAVIERNDERHFSSVDIGILGIKAWHNLGVIYEQQERYELAIAAWRQTLEFDRTNRIAWRGLIDSLVAHGDIKTLEHIGATESVAMVPSEVRLLVKARLLALGGRARDAVERLREALQQGSSAELLDELCQLAFSHEVLDLAEWGLHEKTRISPDDASALQNLGMVYLRRHNYSKAAQYAKRSLQLRPNSLVAQQIVDFADQALLAGGAVSTPITSQEIGVCVTV